MAVHGALAAFKPQEEDWSEYTERLTFYFAANGITTDAKKRAVLLSYYYYYYYYYQFCQKTRVAQKASLYEVLPG